MECVHIGTANPDIAGIGILVAFVIQSLIAVVVSGYTFLLSSVIQERWELADPNQGQDTTTIPPNTPEWLKILRTTMAHVLKYASQPDGSLWLFGKTSESDQTRKASGLSSLPAWLIGKQPEQPRQRTEKSKIEEEHTPTTRRLELANRILLAGSDTQTFTGTALLISALVQSKTLSLYHMHIIYDTISLVIISNCAASICIFGEGKSKGYIRLVLISIWTVLFVAYISIFLARLSDWDLQVPFHCYNTSKTASRGDLHPDVDYAYVIVTFIFIGATFMYAVVLALRTQFRINSVAKKLSDFIDTRISTNPSAWSQNIISIYFDILTSSPLLGGPATELQRVILSVAMLQCPLHIYSMFALRASNEKLLDEGDSERKWGFGQIAAMVLLGLTEKAPTKKIELGKPQK
ncbi:hypothetical protein FB567DRAFT_524657 [Paraphoma chrysanthemicola]|uniref:Uncharacterized protein n=1 Tax=Paraphoma chrysanthemicola TaxID=798071 RepID=A0A8K0W0E8_9PLEO|nr:hypothetical protein FB567DRAFT_524657 [Paraphoma chrysanthemicola]